MFDSALLQKMHRDNVLKTAASKPGAETEIISQDLVYPTQCKKEYQLLNVKGNRNIPICTVG